MLALCYVIKLRTPELPWILKIPLIGSKKSRTLNEDEAEVGNNGRGGDGSENGKEDNDCDITF
jgi:hypothetical protein